MADKNVHTAWYIYGNPDLHQAVDNTHEIFIYPNGRKAYHAICGTRTDNIRLQYFTSDNAGLKVVSRYVRHDQSLELKPIKSK